MKKKLVPVLILSRSFPPSPLTASYRIKSFAESLHNYGYYPIVVTRNWELEFQNYESTFRPSGNKLVNVKHSNYEVYYVPFKGRYSYRGWAGKNKVIEKVAELLDIYIGWHYRFDPHYDLFKFCRNYLAKNNIKHVLVSIPPFGLLSFAKLLKKKEGLKVIVDYRDEWNTEGKMGDVQKVANYNVGRKLLEFLNGHQVQEKRERNALTSVDAILTISENAKQNLSKIFSKEIAVLPNGYVEEEVQACMNTSLDEDTMQLTYSGWLYESQSVDIFLNAFKRLVDKYNKKININLVFIGAESFPKMNTRILNHLKGYEKFVELTPRVSKDKSLSIQRRASLLLLFPHANNNSIPSSKLYEYLALERQIFLCPSDNGIMQQTLNENRIGIVANNETSAFNELDKLYINFTQKKYYQFHQVGILKQTYERSNLVNKLANLLDQLN